MKKFKFVAVLMAAAVTFSVALTSCSSSKEKDKDDDDEKTEKTTEKSTVGKDTLSGDFEPAMDYVEAGADVFFAKLHTVMPTVNSALNGQEPPASELEALEKFSDENESYFEAIGIILAYSMDPSKLTEEQQQRLDAFGEKYSEGLEEFGTLLGIGMAALEEGDVE